MTAILVDVPWNDWLMSAGAVAVRSLIVLAIGGAVYAIARKRASAAARHLILVAVAAAMVLLPLLSALITPIELRVLPSASPQLLAQPMIDIRSLRVATYGTPSRRDNRVTVPSSSSTDSISVLRPREASVPRFHMLAACLLLLWLAGALIGVLRMGSDRAALTQLARRCPRTDDGRLRQALRGSVDEARLRNIMVKQAPDDSVLVPLTWGWLRPTLLLPSQDVLMSWPEERLRAVLHHELAHIRRLDWLSQQAAQAACVLYWFNPLTWLLYHVIKQESEQACDDQAIQAGISSTDYAAHLLDTLRTLRLPPQAPIPHSAQAIARHGSSVQHRIRSILDTSGNRTPLRRPVAASILVIALVTVALVATLRPSARAFDMRTPTPRGKDQSVCSLNLDFRKGLSGWSITATGDNSPNPYYVVGIDPVVSRNGLPCAYLQSSDLEPKGYGALRQDVPAKLYQGRRIRLSGFLKTEGVREYSGFLISVFGPTEDRTWAMAKRPILGTTDWQRYEYVVDVPKGCWTIMLGASLKGPGKVWASEYRLESVGKDVPVTREQPEVRAIDRDESLAPKPSNLGFAHGLHGWYHMEEGDDSTPIAYSIGLDRTIRRDDLPMPYLTSDGSQPNGYGTMVQYFDAHDYRGRRIRFSGLVRTDGVKKFAGLWLGLQQPGWTVWDGEKQPIRGTTNWTRQSIVIDVPQRAEAIGIGIMVHGTGKVWASNLKVEPVNRRFPLTPTTLKMTDAQ